jgi:hypothetical protein
MHYPKLILFPPHFVPQCSPDSPVSRQTPYLALKATSGNSLEVGALAQGLDLEGLLDVAGDGVGDGVFGGILGRSGNGQDASRRQHLVLKGDGRYRRGVFKGAEDGRRRPARRAWKSRSWRARVKL